MNHYTLSEKLRKARRRFTISAGAQALYYELMAISNEEGWSEVFKCTAGELCAALNKSEKSVTGYRVELMHAQLVGYISGKSKRDASTYSLFGSRFGDMIGGNIYHQSEYPKEHQMVTKTPDLNKTESKTESKTLEEGEEVNTRAAEIDYAINDYINPEQPEEEERKKVAPKKELPLCSELQAKIADTANWRNAAEHYKLDDATRSEYFEHFYQVKEDNYRIRLPSANDIAQNFFYWIPSHLSRQKLQNLNNHAVTNANTKHNPTSRQRNEDKRNELRGLKDQSTEFLRRANH